MKISKLKTKSFKKTKYDLQTSNVILYHQTFQKMMLDDEYKIFWNSNKFIAIEHIFTIPK